MSDVNVTVNTWEEKMKIQLSKARTQLQPFDNMDFLIYFEKEHNVSLDQLLKCYIDNELRTVNKF